MKKKTPSKIKFIPLGDRVLIKPLTEEALRQAKGKKTSLNFVLPESMTKEKSAQGKVAAVGPGKYVEGKLVPVGVHVGEMVIFSKYAYEEVEFEGEELFLLKEDNLLAVLR